MAKDIRRGEEVLQDQLKLLHFKDADVRCEHLCRYGSRSGLGF